MEIRVPSPVVRPDWDETWGRDPRDPTLEDRDTRTRLLDGWPGKGILAINLEVGDELGQLYLNTQFEALPDQHNDCQRGQNRALADGAEWLQEILELISADDAEWVVSILSRPCPSSGIAPDVEAARRVLLGQQTQAGNQNTTANQNATGNLNCAGTTVALYPGTAGSP